MNSTALVAGVISMLLGGLWLLQGLGIVHVRPILCLADCAPIQGPSLTWAIAGFAFVMTGVGAILVSLRRRSQRKRLTQSCRGRE
jgi:hypothetical protein